MAGKEKGGAKGGTSASGKKGTSAAGGLEGKNSAVNFNDVMNEIRNTVT